MHMTTHKTGVIHFHEKSSVVLMHAYEKKTKIKVCFHSYLSFSLCNAYELGSRITKKTHKLIKSI
ncbi:hypothetical protein KP509_06G022500 [Ceratopteris richardii]|nr:hypothetical protein KP509_06G022500 [Ceratopteris richardii]